MVPQVSKEADKNKEIETEYLLPLKAIAIEGRLEGPIATLDIEMVYLNDSVEHPIECTYEFPMDKETIFSSLVAKIDDREVVATVKDKSKAKEKYDDAVAKGDAAVYAERKTEAQNETVKIKLGNLLPQQEAKLSV